MLADLFLPVLFVHTAGFHIVLWVVCHFHSMVLHLLGLYSLPPLEGKTGILTINDWLSTIEHFVSLLKLPPTKETTEALFYVFQLHGLPQDMVLSSPHAFGRSSAGCMGLQ